MSGSAPGGDAIVHVRVVEEAGKYAVYMEITTLDGCKSHRIGHFNRRAQAEQAAWILKRAAERDVPPGRFWGL
jgi:hypothetical protein